MNGKMIQTVGPSLAAHERGLLFLLVRGRTTAQAADALGLDHAEAEAMLDRLQTQCGATARSGLIARAAIQSWV